MRKLITHVGVDAHKETLAVAKLLAGEDEPFVWEIPHTAKQVEKLVRKLKKESPGGVEVCYEAGPCGYALQRRIEKLGIRCVVVAPSLIPRKSGDRVKTDRRDAAKLAKYFRDGLLTEVHPPTEEEESVRDVCRALEDAKEDRTRQLHRMQKMLLKLGHASEGSRLGGTVFMKWLRTLKFEDVHRQKVFDVYLRAIEHANERTRELMTELEEVAQKEPYRDAVGRLRCLRGVNTATAVTLVAELFQFGRFGTARELMSYLGLTPSESSSGGSTRRGRITKTGNSHVRRVLIEATWSYRHRPGGSQTISQRRQGQPGWAVALAEKAEVRLHRRMHRLNARGLPKGKAIVAVARELAGFVWAALRARSEEVLAN
jgi:transposase